MIPETPPAEWPASGLEEISACPACGGAQRTVLYECLTDRVYLCAPGSWTLYRCLACRSAYLDPRPTQDTIHLAYRTYYEGASPPLDPAATGGRLGQLRRALRNGYLNFAYGYELTPSSRLGRHVVRLFPRHREEADSWARHFPRPAHDPLLLDVGCGEGAYVAGMRSAGWKAQGIDPDATAVALARRAGLPIEAGVLERGTYPPDHFAALTFRRVLERVHDPVETLQVCHDILRPGGIVWIATPNLDSRGHALFGRDWIFLDPPRHLTIFTPDSLRRLLEAIGFESVSHLPSRIAPWIFRMSIAISRGDPPFHRPASLSPVARLKARWIDLRAKLDPQVADEVVLLARKP